MKNRRIASGIVAGLASAALVATTARQVAANDGMRAPVAALERHGTVSLAQVLAQDKGFDRNWKDFDVLEAAVLAVLDAKPDSPVALLTPGRQTLHGLRPDRPGFRRLGPAVGRRHQAGHGEGDVRGSRLAGPATPWRASCCTTWVAGRTLNSPTSSGEASGS